MKLKKKFDLDRLLNSYKSVENISAKDEEKIEAAFKAGAAAMFKLAVYDIQDLAEKSESKACKALDILEAQVGKFAADQLKKTPSLHDIIEKVFGGGWVETDDFAARRDVLDIRDEDVEEKHRESMEELRRKAAEAKDQGREFTVGINDQSFDDVEEAITYATKYFQDQLNKKREALKEFEEINSKKKAADDVFEKLGEILDNKR